MKSALNLPKLTRFLERPNVPSADLETLLKRRNTLPMLEDVTDMEKAQPLNHSKITV